MSEHYTIDAIFWFKLTHPETIVITLSSKSTCCVGTVHCKYRNFFSRPMILSPSMRRLEICLEVSTSHWDSCHFLFVKQGILRTAPVDAISSLRLKPSSERTGSPKVNFLRNSEFFGLLRQSIMQGGLNKKEIQLNLFNIFSIFIFNKLYLFG